MLRRRSGSSLWLRPTLAAFVIFAAGACSSVDRISYERTMSETTVWSPTLLPAEAPEKAPIHDRVVVMRRSGPLANWADASAVRDDAGVVITVRGEVVARYPFAEVTRVQTNDLTVTSAEPPR